MGKAPTRTAGGAVAVPKEQVSQLPVRVKEGESLDEATARLVLEPTVGGAILTNAYRPYGLEAIPLGRLIDHLAEQSAAVNGANPKRQEAMLLAQAHSLDAIFTRLAMQASNHVGHSADMVDRYLRLALKAQSQCRTTLETLANIKNPPIVYARQANISQGHQQVNNHSVPGSQAGPPEKNSQIPQNELLEAEGG